MSFSKTTLDLLLSIDSNPRKTGNLLNMTEKIVGWDKRNQTNKGVEAKGVILTHMYYQMR